MLGLRRLPLVAPIFGMWRVASAVARSIRTVRYASRSPGAHSFDFTSEDVTSFKVCVRFSFQGPRERASRRCLLRSTGRRTLVARPAPVNLFFLRSLFSTSVGSCELSEVAWFGRTLRRVPQGEEQTSCSTRPRQEGFSFFSEPFHSVSDAGSKRNPHEGRSSMTHLRSAGFLD